MRIVYEQKKKQHHIASLKRNGQTFEVLIIPDKAIAFKKGQINDVKEALEIEGIFKDVKTGERSGNLKEVFGTDNEDQISGQIIKEGNMQFTTEYKRELQEQKKKEIISIISRQGIDPRTNLPIPGTRIELALEQIKINFDPFKSAEEQIETVLDALRPVLPIRFEEATIEGYTGPKYGGKAHNAVARFGKMIKSDWMSDGSWHFIIKIPGGLKEEVIKALNEATHGEVNITQR
ncbi:Ribosome maturation protein SDO1 [Candidatus Tiddalikarchaeum anstoanum]|nr:Ribosome maturation protein SDO1 [Candidatus Tiddalikarchaeum anstoanum]